MKGSTIAIIGVSVAGVGAAFGAYWIAHERGAQQAANALGDMATKQPTAFATWLANGKNGVYPIPVIPMFGLGLLR